MKNKFSTAILLILIWAISCSVFFRNSSENPKVDAIAFYTAGKMAAAGEWVDLYEHRYTKQTVEMVEPAVGVLPNSPLEFQIIEVLPGERFAQVAKESGYAGTDPPVFVYFPILAVLFIPLSWFPWQVATFVFDLLNLLVFGAGIAVWIDSLLKEKPDRTKLLWLAGTLLSLLLFHPFQFSMFCGQVTPMIAGIGMLCILAANKKKWLDVLLGVAVAIIAVMKIYPALLFLIFVVQRSKIRMITCIVSGVMLAGLSLLITGWQAHLDATTIMQHMLEGVRLWTGNQSIAAMINRYYYSTNLTQRVTLNVLPMRGMVVVYLLMLYFFLLPVANFIRYRLAVQEYLLATILFFSILMSHLVWSHYLLFTLPAILYCSINCQQSWGSKIKLLQYLVLLLCITGLAISPDWYAGFSEQLMNRLGESSGTILYRILIGVPTLSFISLYLLMFFQHLTKIIAASKNESGEESLDNKVVKS